MSSRLRAMRENFRQAIPEPQPGTMLNFIGVLAAGLPDAGVLSGTDRIAEILIHLETVVRNTTDQPPKFRKAGCLPAGGCRKRGHSSVTCSV